MKIKEAKNQCKSFIRYLKTDLRDESNEDNFLLLEAIETVLNKLETTEQKYILEKVAKEEVEELLENSVSKDIIRKYLEEEQQRYNVYKKELKENDNLKSGLWRHMGAKNMCEKILGIESLVTLD